LSYIVTAFVFAVGNNPSCQTEQLINGISNTLSTAFTAMLFLFRVLAVFNRHKVAMVIFPTLWLIVVGCTITVPLGIGGEHIGPTQGCINTRVATYTAAAGLSSFINDSIVFLAITYRIISFTLVEANGTARLRAFFSRKSLPLVSRTLILGGQLYYFMALCGNIVLIVMFVLPGVGPIYRGMCTIPVLALNNAMACIVFRKIKFGLISSDGTAFPAFGTSGATGQSIRFQPNAAINDGGVGVSTTFLEAQSGTGSSLPAEFNITRESEKSRDPSGTDFGLRLPTFSPFSTFLSRV